MTPWETYEAMRAVVAELRPDLLPRFKLEPDDVLNRFADMLDEIVPIEAGWSGRSMEDGPALLRDLLSKGNGHAGV
jgi:hypothetical protein